MHRQPGYTAVAASLVRSYNLTILQSKSQFTVTISVVLVVRSSSLHSKCRSPYGPFGEVSGMAVEEGERILVGFKLGACRLAGATAERRGARRRPLWRRQLSVKLRDPLLVGVWKEEVWLDASESPSFVSEQGSGSMAPVPSGRGRGCSCCGCRSSREAGGSQSACAASWLLYGPLPLLGVW